MRFFESYVSELISKGWQVDIATNTNLSDVPNIYKNLGCKIHQLSCTRSPLNVCQNLKALRNIKKILSNENYDIVHCHTPIAGILTRMACSKFRKQDKLKVIYTAHGFHFFKGAPKLNWLLYYPAEWLMSFKTDFLVTINKEDYVRAQRHMHAKKIEYVPGVGIDVEKFKNTTVDKVALRNKYDIPEEATVLLSVGELNKNKNHCAVIQAIADIYKTDDTLDLHYVVCGEGPLKSELLQLAKELNICDRVHLIGFNEHVEQIYKIADLYVHPSFREGLPVSPMEAMASGLPCVAYNIRGCSDLLKSANLASFKPNNLKDKILEALQNPDQNKQNFAVDINTLDKSAVNRQMLNIYTKIND